ncbi:MAG: hypothetical protein ACRBFS_02385 [Aureispira sp.]
MSSKNRKALIKDLKASISLEAFQTKYNPKTTKNCYFIQQQHLNSIGKQVLSFSKVNTAGRFSPSIRLDKHLSTYQYPTTIRWVYDKEALLTTSYLSIFYLPQGLAIKPLPTTYAQLSAYVDCLMNPSFPKMLPPSASMDNYEGNNWISLPKNWQKLPKDKQKSLLDTLRTIRVIGYCSQDSRPREHAVAIATVATHTTQWEVFLRAHLDVLNDRFSRRSDGNYAWKERQTYLQELEVLEINVPDLLLGITLRVDHPEAYHYMGSLGRLGHAILESKDSAIILERLLLMIKDPQLDLFNRRLLANFYWSHLHYLPLDDPILALQIKQLKTALKKLPITMTEGLKFDRWEN